MKIVSTMAKTSFYHPILKKFRYFWYHLVQLLPRPTYFMYCISLRAFLFLCLILGDFFCRCICYVFVFGTFLLDFFSQLFLHKKKSLQNWYTTFFYLSFPLTALWFVYCVFFFLIRYMFANMQLLINRKINQYINMWKWFYE